MTPRRLWTVGHAKRDGVGLVVGVVCITFCYVKPTPAGSRRVEAEGGVWQGRASDNGPLSDGDAARFVTGSARDGRDRRESCTAERTARCFFLR
ncbi:MAG: hypothetical protein WA705_30805, partial [Candidatus Ozemobacteraceae bacterium]